MINAIGMRRIGPMVAFALGLLAVGAGTSEAAFITYTETVTGSGTLGGVSFSGALVTLTQTADTAGVITSGNTNLVQAVTSTVSVAGIGSGSFADATAIAQDLTSGTFSVFRGTTSSGGLLILGQESPGLVGYDLRTAIGPVTGSGTLLLNPGFTFSTSAGGFNLASASGATTFAAAVGVPEPSSLAMCGLAGLAGLGYARARRRRRAVA